MKTDALHNDLRIIRKETIGEARATFTATWTTNERGHLETFTRIYTGLDWFRQLTRLLSDSFDFDDIISGDCQLVFCSPEYRGGNCSWRYDQPLDAWVGIDD